MYGPQKLPETLAGRAFHNHIDQLDLYEASHLRDLNRWFDENDIPVLSEAGYLASFTYISGGWTTETPEYVLKGRGIRTLAQAAQQAGSGELADLGSNVERHDHRKGNNPWRTDDALESLPSLDVNGTPVNSFIHLMRELERHRVQCEQVESVELARTQTFDAAMDTIQSNIDSFGSLTAFDWLEFVVRLHGHEWLCPTTLKPKYIHTGDGPYEGLQRLFGNKADEATDTCLERIERYARDHREMSNTELIFGLESALCMFSPSHLSEEDFRELAENGESQEGSLSHYC
jgi:hypothetical protein